MRTYWRQRNDLVQSASRHIQRMQKVLTQMNVQLANVLSDISGATGQAISQPVRHFGCTTAELREMAAIPVRRMKLHTYGLLRNSFRPTAEVPKGPSAELVRAVVEMKQRNPSWGCPRIAQQIALAFNVQIDKDVVRRILAQHYRPGQNSDGPSWLTFLGHMKDSLWSIDLFRCESATLRTHWVLVVMDQYTRRIIGFGVHAGTVDGVALCRMFNRAIRGQYWMPKYLSSDNDPLYRFSQWQANLRILELTQIRSIPYVPLSHPFVERLIGSVRHEYLDQTFFWTTADLEDKLLDFRTYFNNHRTHTSLKGRTPDTPAPRRVANLHSFRWQPHCRALYQTPVAA